MERIIKLIRYRFFLFAGIFPYLLGQAMAFNKIGILNWPYFFLGFAGIFLVLGGVELFNEYFDFREGGDRIFSKEIPYIPGYFFPLGIFAFFLAFLIGAYFTFKCGWPILLFAFSGFLAAYFYVGPPIRWAYRGLGEAVIALSYGPFMILGSFYMQAGKITSVALLASVISSFAMFSLTLLNEVPDFYQDQLVGKKNLVVRFGKNRAIALSAVSWLLLFLSLASGIWSKKLPYISLSIFLLAPFILNSLRIATSNTENPVSFIPAVRTSLFSYIVVMGFLCIGFSGWI